MLDCSSIFPIWLMILLLENIDGRQNTHKLGIFHEISQ